MIRAALFALLGAASSLQTQSVNGAMIAPGQDVRVAVQGTVVDALGLPIADARVRAYAGLVRTDGARAQWRDAMFPVSRGSPPLDHTTTDASGRYALRVATEHALRVHVMATGYAPVAIDLAVAEQQRLPDAVLRHLGTPLRHVTITGASPAAMATFAGATTVVGRDVLTARAPLTVADALRSIPGMHAADEDPFGLALNIGIRGLPPRRSSRTLLLEDGMPILLGPYGDPSMHYAPPLDVLERVEVVKGSSQIGNGPQTVGGVVNFVTRQAPTDASTADITLGAGARDLRNGALRLGLGRNGRGIALDVVHREGEGVRLEQRHRLQLVSLNGVTRLGDAQTLRLKLSRWQERSATSETGLTQDEFAREPHALRFAAAGRFDVTRHAAQMLHDVNGARVRMRTNAFATQTSRASWRQSGESEERLGVDDYEAQFNCRPEASSYLECGNEGRPRTYTVLGVEPRLTAEFVREHTSLFLEGGVRAYAEFVRRRQFTGATPTAREQNAELTRDNTIDSRVLAGFTQARLRLRALTLAPGVRIEHVTQRNANRFPGQEADARQSYALWLPGLGATLAATHSLTIFAGAHRGFAPPRPADVYRPAPGQPVVLVDPETSMNLELGVRYLPLPGVDLEATTFRMRFANEIIEAPATTGQRFINGGRTLHEGLEVGSRIRLAALHSRAPDVSVSASWMWLPTARFDVGGRRDPALIGNRLPYAPRQLLSTSLSVALLRGAIVGASYEHTGAQFADAANSIVADENGQSGVLPAYGVVHAFASYTIPRSGMTLRTSMRNVLDRTYITQRNEGILTGTRRLLRAEVHWRY